MVDGLQASFGSMGWSCVVSGSKARVGRVDLLLRRRRKKRNAAMPPRIISTARVMPTPNPALAPVLMVVAALICGWAVDAEDGRVGDAVTGGGMLLDASELELGVGDDDVLDVLVEVDEVDEVGR